MRIFIDLDDELVDKFTRKCIDKFGASKIGKSRSNGIEQAIKLWLEKNGQ